MTTFFAVHNMVPEIVFQSRNEQIIAAIILHKAHWQITSQQ